MTTCANCANWQPLDGMWGQAIYETQDTSALAGRGACVKAPAVSVVCHLVNMGGTRAEVPMAQFPVTFNWMRCGDFVQSA